MLLSDPVALTRQLVGFGTVNPPGNEEALARFLAGELEAAGFEVILHAFGEGRLNLIARIRGADDRAPIGFTGHLDTVPLGATAWRFAPHGEIVDGRLYGRGASDMKAGIAAFIAACVTHRDLLQLGSGVELILTGGEETGCEGARAIVDTRADLLRPLGALIVGEPTSNRALIGHKGALWLKGTVHGVTAHGAMPEEGLNAIYLAAESVLRLSTFEPGNAHAVMGRPTLNVGTIRGGLNINSVPDRTEFSIDVRTVPGIDHACLTERLRGHLGYVELSPVVDLPPVLSDPDDGWVARVIALCDAGGAASPASRTVQYFTDAAILSPATGYPPTVILGPGEPDMAHKTDEYCRLDRLQDAVQLYGAILRDWVSRTTTREAT
ncbi:M20 family metallopeptidase [Burkholderia lata]|uniref:M20 family metallopeptidase n=1 Tax=Burkholderia lata (strain ATCC 17760 / DSM 23089 / LMG 22485 / NCIMB 9086 / R18194 / 383) TaxID=482957 RepID=UPI0014535E38|nr:M20 family metallopeptidase [Burkholderia lata]VWL87435.1 acetylornithine deacetylase [Burkholderia lata]